MKNILLLSCAVALCGCAGRLGKTASHFDKVEVVRIQQLARNNLAQTPLAQTVVYLNARCETKRDGKKDYYLFTELIAPAEFTLQTGESLVLNVGGEVYSFAPANSPTGFNARRRYTTTFYRVPAEVLAKLSTASEARVRIKGTNKVIDKKLAKRNLVRFAEFARECSLTATSAPVKGGG